MMKKNYLPKHIAIIMDGNGRWAETQGKSRSYGHEQGAKRVDEIIDESGRSGIEVLTLYVFSMENWQRPQAEISFLMSLLEQYITTKEHKIMKNNIRLKVIGFPEFIPEKVQKRLVKIEEKSSNNTGLTLNLALSYGGRQEIMAAIQNLASEVEKGKITAKDISLELFETKLFTHDVPDPDLLIRTGGEKRLSNYLLWQTAYTELYFTPLLWPEFTVVEFHKALEDFQTRERRYGKIKENLVTHGKQALS